jgi:hypothetical protein
MPAAVPRSSGKEMTELFHVKSDLSSEKVMKVPGWSRVKTAIKES